MYTIKITIPYDKYLSKNFKFGSRYKKYLRKEYVTARNTIIRVLRVKVGRYPRPIPKTKVYVDYYWYREKHNGDTSNFREGIEDAVKVCIPIDDRYFAGKQDWFIDKENPRLEISITITEHELA